jgi:hypothetical protein
MTRATAKAAGTGGRYAAASRSADLRHLRLTAVRNELSQEDEAIGRVAARNGFTHFDRFATAYRECFGETPSATRRRLPRDGDGLTTARDRATPAVPSLVIIACGVDGCGREIVRGVAQRRAIPHGPAAGRRRGLTGLDPRIARFALAARVIREAGQIRVVTRLAAREHGRHLWAETFDGTPGDGLAFQARLA